MMRLATLKKIGQTTGEQSNIPVGFEVEAIIDEDPKVGERFKIGDFETAVVVAIEGDNVCTKKSLYTLTTKQEVPVAVKHPDINNLGVSISINIREESLGDALGMNDKEVSDFAEKCSAAYMTSEGKTPRALRYILPKLTEKEIAFMCGSFLEDSFGRLKKHQELGKSAIPDKLKDFLKKFGLGD